MRAIIRTGGKQYRVESGEQLNVEKLTDTEPGEEIEIEDVLSVGEGEDLTVGRPILDDAVVRAEIVEHGLGDKKIVYKKRAKQGYEKKRGHRQPFTRIKITEIDA